MGLKLWMTKRLFNHCEYLTEQLELYKRKFNEYALKLDDYEFNRLLISVNIPDEDVKAIMKLRR